MFWKQQATTVWMPTLTFTSYLILDTLWIYLILDFSIYIPGTIISEGYFKEFNDILHVEGIAHFLVYNKSLDKH